MDITLIDITLMAQFADDMRRGRSVSQVRKVRPSFVRLIRCLPRRAVFVYGVVSNHVCCSALMFKRMLTRVPRTKTGSPKACGYFIPTFQCTSNVRSAQEAWAMASTHRTNLCRSQAIPARTQTRPTPVSHALTLWSVILSSV